MTISSETNSIPYAGNGVTVDFSFPYLFYNDADLLVLRVASDGTVTTLVLNVDYTIDGAGASIGGTVTTTVAPAAGTTLTITRSPAAVQESHYVSTQPFPSATVERGYDYLTMLCQRLLQRVKAAIHYPDGESNIDATLASVSTRKGTYLFFDAVTGAISYALNLAVTTLTQAVIGGLLYPRTAAEIAAGVTPTNYAYADGDVRRYGWVADDATDNQIALSNAFLSRDSTYGGDVWVPRGIGRIASNVTTSRTKIKLRGEKGAEIKVVGSILGVEFTGDHADVDGIRFTSTLTTGTPPVGLKATDASWFRVTNCYFNRLCLNDRCDLSTAENTFYCVGNIFAGDWTGWSGSDSTNVIDVRGVWNVTIENNKFENVGLEKLIKVSCSTGQTNTPIGAWRSKRLVVVGNTIEITSTNGITVIDFFASTEEVVIATNTMNVAGTFAHIIHCKPGDLSTTQSPYENNITVSGNTIVGSSSVTDCILLNGAWGTAWFSVNQNCVVNGNTINHAALSSNATVNIKGMNIANVNGNNFVTGASGNFRHALLMYNNQLNLVSNNHSSFGNFDFAGNGSTPDGLAYTNQPEAFSITGNIIDDFDSQGAISFFNCTAVEDLLIADNIIRNQTDTASVVGGIHFSTVTITDLDIHDNRMNLANAAKNLISGTPTVTTYRMHDNSWNTISFTYDPGNLVDGAGETSAGQTLTGAAFGGVVDIAAPYDLQGITVTAYVSAANTIKVRVQNESTATVDLASGTWRASYRRRG